MPGFQLGPYRLLERLGKGGGGEVYRAVGTNGLPCAVKVLLPHLEALPRVKAAFRAEAQLGLTLKHPNVIETFDVGEDDGRTYLVMAFVDGTSLERALKGPVACPFEVWLHVARSLCAAVAYVHGLKGPGGAPLALVHRDVSPLNTLVSRAGDVYLTDFGIARAQSSAPSTDPGVVKGRSDFLAPETARLGGSDQRSDVYALSLTLYALAAGRSPFLRATPAATLDAVMDAPLAPLHELRPDFPPAIGETLALGLARDPALRLASAAELGQRLDLASGSVEPSRARTAAWLAPQLPLPKPALPDEPKTRTESIDSGGGSAEKPATPPGLSLSVRAALAGLGVLLAIVWWWWRARH